MADAPNSSTDLPLRVAHSPISGRNIAPFPECGNVRSLTGDFNMDPLSLNPECIPLTLLNSYPQPPFNNPLNERFTDQGSITQGEPEVGMNTHLPTTSQLKKVVVSPRNHTAIHNHNFVNLGLSSTPWDAAFEDNTALNHQHGNVARNLIAAPTIQPVQFQSRVGQHNIRTNLDKSVNDARPILRCKWEGSTSRRHFNREADLVRHIKTIHISPRSYKCTIENCSKTYNRGDNLKEHMLRVHQISHDA